jgi:hypothetical protein
MTPIRVAAFVLALLLSTVPFAPASFAQEEPSPAGGPAVVLEEDGPGEDDEAWTFRFLVPTLLAVTGVALGATIVVYGVRVKGRYRVVR